MSEKLLQLALAAGDARQTIAAARSLAELPADQLAPLLPLLGARLSSSSVADLRRAALVCGVLGSRAVSLTPPLRDLVSGKRWLIREAALHALERIDPREAATRSAAANRAIDDPASAVRDAALELLSHEPAVPSAILEALRHQQPKFRCRALRAVARLAPGDHAGTLEAALGDSHRRVRRTAALALGELGELARPTLPRLARVRLDGDPYVARAARFALGRLRSLLPAGLLPLLESHTDPTTLLAELLDQAHQDVRLAICALRQTGDERSRTRWLIGRLVQLTMTRSDNP